MREILFRCWNKFDKKFIYFKEGLYNSDIDFKESSSPSYFFNWEHAEQFTGLLDKNGNKIFEGDVTNYGIIIFEYGCFGINGNNGFVEINSFNLSHIEIIENIHELK